jgi:flavin reductase (DIM6/NTAB) family NADH-FMN oxidoreductase RutF
VASSLALWHSSVACPKTGLLILPHSGLFILTLYETILVTQRDSFFNMANHNPPIISISTYTMGDAPKDTARNIIDTKEFTVNIIAEPFVEAANFTSVEAPAEADEWIGSGLTREPSVSNRVLPMCVAP